MTVTEKKAAEAAAAEQKSGQTETADQITERELTTEVKELLKRYGLNRAIVEQKSGQVYFDAALIERLLEKDAEAYTEIKA